MLEEHPHGCFVRTRQMASITVTGRVTKPCEIKFFDSGTSVARVSMVDREYVRPEKKGEEAPGQFYDCEIWGKTGEIAADRLSKGSRVSFSGQAVWREWVDKSGGKRKNLTVKVNSVTYLDTKEESEALKGSAAPAPAAAATSDFIPF